MMALYDDIYDVEEYFGETYKELIAFFKKLPEHGKILDMGCGQGRDAIPLAKLGYQVYGIDISKLGIEQMLQNAKNLKLQVEAEVTDMFSYQIQPDIDIVILNSMLHFEKNDKKKEVTLLKRISQEIKLGGIICVCIWKSKTKEKIVHDIFNSSNWEILNDTYVNYTFRDKKSDHKVDMQYNMFIVKKAKK